MSSSIRKLIGTVLLVTFVIVYFLAVIAIAPPLLVGAGPWGKFSFYAIGGLAWVIPAAGLIKWMTQGDRAL